MLHILLLILKWIGILLLAILLLALVLVCLVLFVPIRYKADISCQNSVETLKANVEISWMWRLFFLMANWKEGKADLKMRFAWKDFFAGKEAGDVKEETDDEEKTPFVDEAKVPDLPEAGNKNTEKAENVYIENEETQETESPSPSSENGKEVQLPQENPDVDMRHTEESTREQERLESDRKSRGKRKIFPSGKYPGDKKRKKSLWERLREKFLAWVERCKAFGKKLLAIGRNIRGKKEQIERFLCDASHKRAFHKLLKEIGIFFRDISPKNVKIVGKIGLEDPYMTGQLLAVLGVLFPFLGEHTVIVPDFENPVLDGSAHIEGEIRNIRMAAILWRIFTDRDVRKIIIDIKKLKW